MIKIMITAAIIGDLEILFFGGVSVGMLGVSFSAADRFSAGGLIFM